MNLRFLTLVVGLVTGLVSHSASAQASAPTQGGEVNLVRATATTMELSFGTFGTGQGRVVAIAAAQRGVPVPLTVVDNQFYTAATTYGQGTALGKGYIIYNGSGHSITVTGLQPSTYYYVTNAEYNADGASIMYNTRGSSMGTATRAAPSIPAPLPVELTAFTGAVDGRNMATLSWATASERNTAYFALERSADGNAFAEAGQLKAAGTSSQPLAYQWPDPQPLLRATYYRLRQADRNGEVHYSAVVLLVPHQAKNIDVYPNPSAGQQMQLLMQGYENNVLSLKLSDAIGRPVMTQQVTPASEHYLAPLPLPLELAAGTYILTLTGSGSPVQKRIVVSN
jgi:hypothetical protein